MSDLPEGWEWSTVGETTTVQLGRQRSPKNHSGPYMRPYLRSANVTWHGIDVSDVKEMNFEPAEAAVFELNDGDILLNEASGSPNEVGKPAIWRNEVPGACFQNTLLRVRSTEMHERYLYWYFYGAALTGRFGEAGRGVNIRHLGKRGLTSFPVPVPPLPEQRRIVAAIEEHFSRLDAANAAIESARGRNLVLASQLIDAAWEVGFPSVPLQEVLAEPLANGRSVTTDPDGFPVLRLTALRSRRIDLSERKGGAWTAVDATNCLVRRDDFLIARGNGSLSLVGRGGLVDIDPDPIAYPDTLIRARCAKDRCLPEYLALVWDSRPVRRRLESLARTTAGIYKVNQKMLQKIELPVPSVEKQAEFVLRTHDQLELASQLNDSISITQRRSAAFRRSILAAAFSGKLVPQDPSDEPASALLERIAAERAAAKPSRRKRKTAS